MKSAKVDDWQTYYFCNADDVLRSFQAKRWGKEGGIIADRCLVELGHQTIIKWPGDFRISLDPETALALHKAHLERRASQAESSANAARIRVQDFKESQTATLETSYRGKRERP